MSLSKKEAFSFTEEHKAIRPKIGELASILIKGKLNDIIPQDNVLRYSHGKSWKVHRDDGFDEEVDQFKTASATLEIKFDDVLAHNLQAIPDFFDSLINQMYDSHMKSFVELLTNVTNKTGNIVSAKEIGNAPAFLEMLRKVEFGINSKGEVSLPQIYRFLYSVFFIAR
jgi:hypothetical protein